MTVAPISEALQPGHWMNQATMWVITPRPPLCLDEEGLSCWATFLGQSEAIIPSLCSFEAIFTEGRRKRGRGRGKSERELLTLLGLCPQHHSFDGDRQPCTLPQKLTSEAPALHHGTQYRPAPPTSLSLCPVGLPTSRQRSKFYQVKW